MSAWNTRIDFGINFRIMVACQKQCVINPMDTKIAAMAGHFSISYDRFSDIWLHWIYVGISIAFSWFLRHCNTTHSKTHTHKPHTNIHTRIDLLLMRFKHSSRSRASFFCLITQTPVIYFFQDMTSFRFFPRKKIPIWWSIT